MVSLAFLFILIISIPGFCFENRKQGTYHLLPRHTYDTPNSCCHSYARRIPYSRVVDFYETSSHCLKPGIIFLTNKGHRICANPRSEWVKVYIFRMKQEKH